MSIPEEKEFSNRKFPLTLSPDPSVIANISDFSMWLVDNKASVDKLLFDHKAILFRGFEVCGHDDFHEVIQGTGYLGMPYIGGAAVRTQLTSRVFTANESPASEKIPFHHELAQTPDPPTHLFFYCEVAPSVGGETPLLISSELYYRLAVKHQEYLDHIERLGVRYVRIMPEQDDPSSAIGRGWKSTFLCEDRAGAEQALRELGSTWEWLDNNNLRTVTSVVPGKHLSYFQVISSCNLVVAYIGHYICVCVDCNFLVVFIAIRTDTGENRTNQKTFFNSMVAAYTGWNDCRNIGEKAVLTGDGSLLSPDFMSDAVSIMNEIRVCSRWQEGDVILVDNRTAMHSRSPYEGKRRVLAALARDPER